MQHPGPALSEQETLNIMRCIQNDPELMVKKGSKLFYDTVWFNILHEIMVDEFKEMGLTCHNPHHYVVCIHQTSAQGDVGTDSTAWTDDRSCYYVQLAIHQARCLFGLVKIVVNDEFFSPPSLEKPEDLLEINFGLFAVEAKNRSAWKAWGKKVYSPIIRGVTERLHKL
jgi:hypothetical protein